MQRPTRKDVDLKPIAKDFVDELIGDEDIDGYVEQLIECINIVPMLDGYEMARYLDQGCNWAMNALAVSELDEIGSVISYELHNLVCQWVSDNNLKSAFAEGDTVKYRDQSGVYSGEIIRIDLKDATYTVRVAGLGHSENAGIVMTFEDLEKDQ